MDDEREILFIALSNSLQMNNKMLEASKDSLNKDQLELLQYTINRHEELLIKYSNQILEEEVKPIKRPQW